MTLPTGKLPPELLNILLSRLRSDDPRVLLGPALGRDAAVLDVGGGHVLVATADPITFTGDRAGWYAVHVNANDIACMGAEPAWLLATALLPPGTRADEVRALFDDLQAAASSLGVSLVGGHTEVTAAVTQPVIAATMLGLAERDDVITGEGVVPGDAVLLAGKIAIEGTALLARDCASALRERGVPEATIAAAASMLDDPGISVVPAARTIREATHPRLLHDPTEGGIATALMELAHSARATLRIDAGAIPVRAETRTVCDTLELDPLGLLASGALLAIIERGSTDAVIAALTGAGVPAGVIGRVESGGPEVIMASDDRASPGAVPFPRFERDELARYLEGASVSRVQPEGPS